MNDDEWTTVQPRRKRFNFITELEAQEFQHDLDIVGLSKVLLSIESKNLQADGWKFHGILRGDGVNTEESPEDTSEVKYTWLPIPNKWNDRVLYKFLL